MKNSHVESQKRLEHILKAIEAIESYVRSVSLETFSQSSLINNAVLHNFTIIGEAINHVESEKLNKYEYPWYKVRSFRNMIAHEYFNLKLSAVWMIIVKDMPQLKLVVSDMLKNEF